MKAKKKKLVSTWYTPALRIILFLYKAAVNSVFICQILYNCYFVILFIQISYGFLFSYCLNNELKPVMPLVKTTKKKRFFLKHCIHGVLPLGADLTPDRLESIAGNSSRKHRSLSYDCVYNRNNCPYFALSVVKTPWVHNSNWPLGSYVSQVLCT